MPSPTDRLLAVDPLHAFVTSGNIDLRGQHWQGWRIRGRDLISPAGERVNARRLAGLLFVDGLTVRAKRVLQGGGVVVGLPERVRAIAQQPDQPRARREASP